jgi:hypothetical protein
MAEAEFQDADEIQESSVGISSPSRNSLIDL